jgi:hypothetical protein
MDPKPTIKDKARYVQEEAKKPQSREHKCHWPGCEEEVPPAMWGCKWHWRLLPRELRDEIWEAYRPGQEKDMRPSARYIEVARKAQEWIDEYLKSQKGQ